MPLVLGPQRRRNANLPGDMLNDGGGDFAGIARKAAQELKELKQDRETEPAHSGRIVQTALLVRLQSRPQSTGLARDSCLAEWRLTSIGLPQIFAIRCLKISLSSWNKCPDKVSSHM
jgi:hypothetical protein